MKNAIIIFLLSICIISCGTTNSLVRVDANKPSLNKLGKLSQLTQKPVSETTIRQAPTLEQLQKQYTETQQNAYRIEGAINLLLMQKQEKDDLSKKEKENRNKKQK
jgi:hypothetical protein